MNYSSRKSYSNDFGGNHPNLQQQTFSFPLLSNTEILQTWDDVPLQAKDLEKPTASSVRAIYEVLFDQCIGPIVREDIYNPIQSLQTEMQFPELYEDSIIQLNFFQYLCRLMSAAGVNDTCMDDILKPDPKRFRRNLCAIINFQKFRLEREEAFEKLHNEWDLLINEKADLEDECTSLENQIKQIQEERKAQLPLIEKLQEECLGLENDLKISNKEHENLIAEVKQLKIQNNELKDELASIRFQEINIIQECESLEKNIVRSPARLKKELFDQEKLLKTEKSKNAQLEKKVHQLKKEYHSIKKNSEKTEDILQIIKDLESVMLDCKKATKETKQMSNSVKDHKNNLRQIRSQRSEFERQIELANDRLARLCKTKSLKIAAATHALKQAKDERDTLHKENKVDAINLDKELSKIEQIENKIESQQKNHQKSMEKRREALKALDNLFQKVSSHFEKNYTRAF